MKGRKPSTHDNQPKNPAGIPPEANESCGGATSKEQDRFLPKANVSRIMKKSLPSNAKVSKEAKQAVQECVSEFISFITGEASDKCQREKRKTINGDDLLWAMKTLGFHSYVVPLNNYLSRYKESGGEKNCVMRGRQMSEEGSGGGGGGGGGGLYATAGPAGLGFRGGNGFYERSGGGSGNGF